MAIDKELLRWVISSNNVLMFSNVIWLKPYNFSKLSPVRVCLAFYATKHSVENALQRIVFQKDKYKLFSAFPHDKIWTRPN